MAAPISMGSPTAPCRAQSPPSVFEQRVPSRAKRRHLHAIENEITRSTGFDGPAEVIGHRPEESRSIDRRDQLRRWRPSESDSPRARHREFREEILLAACRMTTLLSYVHPQFVHHLNACSEDDVVYKSSLDSRNTSCGFWRHSLGIVPRLHRVKASAGARGRSDLYRRVARARQPRSGVVITADTEAGNELIRRRYDQRIDGRLELRRDADSLADT